MSNTNGSNTMERSMNGIITYDDGAGTVIENGIITTNGVQTNNILAEYTDKPCSLFANSTSSGVSLGNPNQATYVRSYWAPVSGYDVINYLYLTTTYYINLLGLTNVWTGVSNTFNNVIYVSLISPIGTILSLGSATSVTTSIQNNVDCIIAQKPATIIPSGMSGTLQGNGFRLYSTSLNAAINFYSAVGVNLQSSRIWSYGGGAAAYSGALAIDSGSIALTASTGNINLLSSVGVVNIEGLKFDTTSITPITPTATITIGTPTSVTQIGMVEIDDHNIDCVTTLGDLNIGISNAGRLNIGGQSPTVFGGGTRITTDTIDLASAGTLNIGSATTTLSLSGTAYSYIKNTVALILGTNPTSYNNSTGTIIGTAMRFYNVTTSSILDFYSSGLSTANSPSSRIISSGGTAAMNSGTLELQSGTVKVQGLSYIGTNIQSTAIATTTNFFNNGNTVTLNIGNNGTTVNIGGTKTNLSVNSNYSVEASAGSNNAFIDFHSYATAVNDYDARIICNGASAGVGTGTLQFFSANNIFNGAVNCYSGLSFANSNFSGQKMMGLTISVSGNIGPLSSKTGTYTFAYAFGSIPFCIATNTTATGNPGTKLTISCYGLSTTTCHVNFYNQSTATTITGTYTANIIGFGNYT